MLESIGILAGGIAHDFNNILTAILGNLSLAKLDVAPGDTTWTRLVEAEKAAIRAQSLTRQLLTFSKGGAPVRQASAIGQLIEESANFAIRGTTIKCRIAIAPDLHPVDIDPGQIGQVINNIVLNASQAMPDGGINSVDARNVAAGDVPERNLPPGDYAMITIKDQGAGIPRENIPKIFNPFFTTKTKGTGLGLATAYSIVKRHDGAISVDSALGRGTTVSIFLPGSRLEVPEIPSVRTPPCEGKGRILVMDDEEMVRDVAASLLESMGYLAHAVKDGSEAIDAYLRAMKEGMPFDAAILDLTVPGAMGGKECVRRLLDIDADAKVIVSSGYSQDPILSMYRDYGFSGVIAKPYQMGELGQAIQLVLPRPASRNN
jgi:CheY-like chemotaxis protein